MSTHGNKDKYFYAIEFEGGFLKVGIGRSVKSRVAAHTLTASLM